MKNFTWAVALALAISVSGFAAEKKDMKPMDPAMAKMMELGTPGAGHKVLAPLAGKWNFTVQHWMKPGDKAEMSSGTSEISWIYGGRYLKQKVKGDMMGQPFEGMGFVGYDNMKQMYQSLWFDNMSTAIMVAEGTFNAAKKTLMTQGTFSCPMTNEKDRWMRSDWKIMSNDQNTYTSYMKDETGKEFKAMEIVYKRMK